ncbi:DUF6864 domain-containing function [Pseudoalteromonas sp. XMcav1-K]|uniref:DUF6864 domain-containing function n=1 Tax=Pseudoalteromonas sp. XMcav1-K TaxID=3374372 RepID=UPI003756CD9B
MIQNSQYPLKVTTSSYEVIASGVVHITEPEVTFNLANLTIKFVFKSDSDGTKLEAEVVDDALIVSLYNFNNSLGQGKIEPMEIGNLDGRRLFSTFFINTPDSSNVRQFNYTFMLMEA